MSKKHEYPYLQLTLWVPIKPKVEYNPTLYHVLQAILNHLNEGFEEDKTNE